MPAKPGHPALTAPQCTFGYPVSQLENELTRDEWNDLDRWLDGQTMAICSGQVYNHDKGEYEPSLCAGEAHGTVVYVHDVKRWLAGQPIID